MGGFFSPQQTPAQVIDPLARALYPFREEFVRAISGLLAAPPGYNLTGLEEQQILNTAQLAPISMAALAQTAAGEFLPGQSQGNPFLEALLQGIEEQGNVARRQLAAAAQRAGALSSTDYAQQAAGLEAALAQKKGELLANLFEQERGRQLQAATGLPGVSAGFTDLFGLGRRARMEAIRWPFELGAGVMGGQRAAVQPGETRPSPFASLLSGLAPFAPIFVKV